MNLKQALAIFWSRRTTIIVVFVAALASAIAAAFTMTPQYTARAQLFVNLSEPNAATNAQVSGAVVRSYISTQVEALRSRGTAAAVAIAEGLVNDPALVAAFRRAAQDQSSTDVADIADWIGGSLQRSLEVSRQGASDVISVSFRSENPATASRLTNAFVDTFMRRDIELRSGPGQEIVRWHEEQLKSLRERFVEIEAQRSLLRLEAIRRGDLDATGTPDPNTSLPNVIATARNNVIQARSALELARSGQNPPTDNAELLLLRRSLSDVELNIKRELPLLGPTHRRIQNLRSNAEQLQNQIAAAVVRLRADLVADRERELAAAERRVADATSIMSQDESQRNDQSRARAAAAAMDRELESLKGQIDNMVQRRERALVGSAVNVGNISVLTRAAPPTSPSWPRIPIILGVAAGIGLAFGFALAFLREMLDRRVRCVDDLSSYFDVPVLGEIVNVKLSKALTALPPIADRSLMMSRNRSQVIEVREPVGV